MSAPVGPQAVLLQPELPLATVNGEPWLALPEDLYIPPDALELVLESFEGPLDLLWYLIRRQNFNVLDIPIAEVTGQYLRYIEMMQTMRIELAAEYLLMVAILADIKSRMLLPKPINDDPEHEMDPRAELVRQLQEYEIFRHASERIDALPRLERDCWVAQALAREEERRVHIDPPPVSLQDLLLQMAHVVHRTRWRIEHRIVRDSLSVRECMVSILELLAQNGYRRFEEFCSNDVRPTRIVLSFVAALELARQSLVDLVQPSLFGPLYIQRTNPDHPIAPQALENPSDE
ncbi:MAG: segregation and condensation protein A [Gammaproteobacteria bacterium]